MYDIYQALIVDYLLLPVLLELHSEENGDYVASVLDPVEFASVKSSKLIRM